MDISWLFGRAQISYHSSNQTFSLPLNKNTKNSRKQPSTDLLTFVKSIVPTCTLNPLLPGGNIQTIYTAFDRTDVPIHYKRRTFQSTHTQYPGDFDVDFVWHAPTKPSAQPVIYNGVKLHPRTVPIDEDEWSSFERGSDDSKPMLVVLHGLSGGSHEQYLRATLEPLVLGSAEESRWEACVVNARACARSRSTSGVLFNARTTWDVRQVCRWLREKFPNRPLFGLGFSLGSNIMVNYLGEEGEECALKAAVVISNPWDLAVGSAMLQSTWIGREVYSATMGASMKKLFEQHYDDIVKHNQRFNAERVRNAKYLHEFDREFQGPTWGYPTEGAYYRDASSVEPLLGVRIPLFAIHAEDDPVCSKYALPFIEVQKNPYAVLCTTTLGGHLGWFESNGTRWFVKPTVNFFRKMIEEVDLTDLQASKSGEISSGYRNRKGVVDFDPMKRKLETTL